MKKLLGLIGATGLAASTIASTAFTNVSNIENKQNDTTTSAAVNADKFSEEFVAVSNEFVARNSENEQILRSLIETSVEVNNGVYSLNADKLESIKNEAIYAYLTHEAFSAKLEEMVNLNILVQNDEGFTVQSAASQTVLTNAGVSTFTFGAIRGRIWIEYRWYWVAYFQVHFDREASASLSQMFDAMTIKEVVTSIIGSFPGMGFIAEITAAFMQPIKWLFDWGSNGGNGVAIAFAAGIPIWAWQR